MTENYSYLVIGKLMETTLVFWWVLNPLDLRGHVS